MTIPNAHRPNTWDQTIFESIVDHNEYKIGNFKPEDIVIDIGCHIGSFAYLAKMRGAGTVLGFEPFPDNYAYAVQNTAHLENVLIQNAAVIRSDFPKQTAVQITDDSLLKVNGDYNKILPLPSLGMQWRKLSPNEFIQEPVLFYKKSTNDMNTGGGDIFTSEGLRVSAIPFDDILDNVGRIVRMVKLDCEGSEFPILFTSKRLASRVIEIVGEYHEFPTMDIVPDHLKVGKYFYDMETLHKFMVSQEFDGSYEHVAENLGKFRYKNMRRDVTGWGE